MSLLLVLIVTFQPLRFSTYFATKKLFLFILFARTLTLLKLMILSLYIPFRRMKVKVLFRPVIHLTIFLNTCFVYLLFVFMFLQSLSFLSDFSSHRLCYTYQGFKLRLVVLC